MCLEMLLHVSSQLCVQGHGGKWEIAHDGNIYTAEIGRHCEPGLVHPLGLAGLCSPAQHSLTSLSSCPLTCLLPTSPFETQQKTPGSDPHHLWCGAGVCARGGGVWCSDDTADRISPEHQDPLGSV